MQNKFKVLTLVGGISRDSLNKKLYQGILEQNYENFEFFTYDISKLPYYSQDIENDPPDAVTSFKDKIREADAILFITPEYNRSFPGVLKNAIDWGSRPYGESLWKDKPAAVMGASVGNIGTFGAQHHLRQSLAYLDMHVMAQPEFYFNGSKSFNEQGKLTDDKTKKLLKDYFDSFEEQIQMVSSDKNMDAPRFKSQGLEDSQFTH